MCTSKFKQSRTNILNTALLGTADADNSGKEMWRADDDTEMTDAA